MGVVLTIVFFMLSIWSESKSFMLLTFLTINYDFFGLFTYIIGIVALLIGLYLAIKE